MQIRRIPPLAPSHTSPEQVRGTPRAPSRRDYSPKNALVNVSPSRRCRSRYRPAKSRRVPAPQVIEFVETFSPSSRAHSFCLPSPLVRLVSPKRRALLQNGSEQVMATHRCAGRDGAPWSSRLQSRSALPCEMVGGSAGSTREYSRPRRSREYRDDTAGDDDCRLARSLCSMTHPVAVDRTKPGRSRSRSIWTAPCNEPEG
jgi:hypothetical protein